jgi:hypothetical protein
MCPTPVGRIHTRVAIIAGPAIAGLIMTLITGNEEWIVLIGIYFLIGMTLDAVLYSTFINYQPPWMTFVLAIFEWAILIAVANLVEIGIPELDASIFYWVVWVIAIWTKVVLLPIFSLTYLESAAEFRRVEWSVPPSQAIVPILAAPDEAANAQAGPVIQAASGAHAIPLELKPSPSGVFKVPTPPNS